MKTAAKIFVDEDEFDYAKPSADKDDEPSLNSGTSVMRLKAHFFEDLSNLGEIVKFSKADVRAKKSDLANAFHSKAAIVASFHEPPPELPCRLLNHTKGGLMLTGGFLGPWTIRESTLNYVETERQKKQIEGGGGSWKIPLAVYAQRLAHDVFYPNSKPSHEGGCRKEGFSLIYAGRFIPNKGLAQLIRGLNIWPLNKCSLSLVGSWEPEFWISQSGSQCTNFRSWFSRELISRNRNISLSVSQPVRQDKLAELHRNCDAFLYPSFHEDEASGNAAHEAVLSGIPAIVTDWSGLGQLGRNTRGGAISTYPTLAGIRYSLKSVCDQIRSVCNKEHTINADEVNKDIEWVRSTFDSNKMKESLNSGIQYLLKQNVQMPLPGGWRNVDRLQMIIETGPEVFSRALKVDPKSVVEGLYTDGLGYESENYSEAHFLTAIQSLYTTWPTPPILRPGVRLHGFWRVSLWEKEQAIVEFSFPGPRVLRFSKTDWRIVAIAAIPLAYGDFGFEIHDANTAGVFQRAIDLGYLVPDNPMQCELPKNYDCLL